MQNALRRAVVVAADIAVEDVQQLAQPGIYPACIYVCVRVSVCMCANSLRLVRAAYAMAVSID